MLSAIRPGVQIYGQPPISAALRPALSTRLPQRPPPVTSAQTTGIPRELKFAYGLGGGVFLGMKAGGSIGGKAGKIAGGLAGAIIGVWLARRLDSPGGGLSGLSGKEDTKFKILLKMRQMFYKTDNTSERAALLLKIMKKFCGKKKLAQSILGPNGNYGKFQSFIYDKIVDAADGKGHDEDAIQNLYKEFEAIASATEGYDETARANRFLEAIADCNKVLLRALFIISKRVYGYSGPQPGAGQHMNLSPLKLPQGGPQSIGRPAPPVCGYVNGWRGNTGMWEVCTDSCGRQYAQHAGVIGNTTVVDPQYGNPNCPRRDLGDWNDSGIPADYPLGLSFL